MTGSDSFDGAGAVTQSNSLAGSLTVTVTDVQPSATNPNRGTVFTTNEVFNQDGELVMTLKARGFFARRTA
jgi:acyl dehydratase